MKRNQDQKQKQKHFSTGIWVGVLLAMALCAGLSMLCLTRSGASSGLARIYQDGTLIQEIDLSSVSRAYSFDIEDVNGGFNTVTVRPGSICVSDADCSDHSCVRQGWLEGGLTPIVCLPHKLVIQLETASDTAAEESFDALSQ